MTASTCSVTEAELYLQTVHTRTNSALPNDQIRDLVTLARGIIAAKDSIPQTMWAKAEGVVNALIQTSEHLQQEQCKTQLSVVGQSTAGNSPGASVAARRSDCQDNASGPGSTNLAFADGKEMLHNGPVNNNTEEIGDIEWEGMAAGDVKFDHVVGCAGAIDAIRESVVIPMQYPVLFKRLNVKRSNGIMLYGPPGTGKSMIARATAAEVKATFFNASCADLTSRWVGGSEKKLKSLFAAAVRNSPSIIFFDEVDSIACKREGDGSIADQRLTNQLLIELDKIFLAQHDVFVIAATNLPWQIDLAVMRRFPHTVYIELPNLHSRTSMFRSFFDTAVCSDADIDELANIAQNMSGSDIANIVNSVLFEPIRTLCRATHFLRALPLPPEHTQHTEPAEPSTAPGFRITVATAADIDRYSTCEPQTVDYVETLLLCCSLSEVVLEYGEDCVAMPTVNFDCIRAKVSSFRHTVSNEYLQQYVVFHNQRS